MEGKNKIRIGNNSSLPASISKDNSNLDSHEKFANPPAGPTAPSPGPILEIQDKDAVNIVIGVASLADIFGFQIEINNAETTIIIIYNTKKVIVESTTFLSKGLPSRRITSTFLGDIIFMILEPEYLVKMMIRDCFIPPAVEPAHEPHNIKNRITPKDNAGHGP